MAEYGETLSTRELDVLGCIVNGASNKDVAAELHISQNTVKVHLRNIYTKLGASSRTEAVTLAVQQGIATIPGTTAQTEPEETDTEPIIEETAVLPPASEPTPELPSEPTTKPQSSRNWLVGSSIGIIVLILLITAVYIGYQSLDQQIETPLSALPATPEPFAETPIEQTNWAISRPLTTPLTKMAVASVGVDIYHIGGETETGTTNLVNRFDTATYTWHEMTEKQTAVSDTSADVLFGEIYVPGGLAADGTPTNIVEAYSPINNAWRPIANLPKPISGGLTVSDGSYLYIAGGWDGNKYLDDLYLYDANNDSWRPLSNLPTPLAAAAGGVIAGELYVLGGTDGETTFDTCFIYNIDQDAWRNCQSMLVPRSHAGAAIILNKLYILGGDEAVGGELPFGEFYDPTTETWQVVNTPILESASSWKDLGTANVETKIYALGGQMGNAISDGNYAYSPLIYKTFIPAASSGNRENP